MNTAILRLMLGVLLGLAVIAARAEQSSTFGDYTVHYNAFTTDILTPEVAKAYGIQRSKSRALLNVSVLKKVMGTTGQPVRAKVEASATNLSSQLRQLSIREVTSQDGGIYYLAETSVGNGETLRFTVSVTPEGGVATTNVTFEQQFVTE